MFDPSNHSWLVLALAGACAALSIARTARLLTHDEFPPVRWLRAQALGRLPEDWQLLATCPFCLAPYLTAGMFGWCWLSDLDTWWWVVNGWWAMSYVAAIVVARDEPAE